MSIMRDMDRPAMSIVCVGECTIDYYVDLQREFVGGISLNFAVNCRRSGAESVALVSRVGEDHGSKILQELSSEAINASHVTMEPGATARQNIVVAPGGDRIFPPGGYQPGVLDDYRLNDSELEFVKRHNILSCALFTQVEPLFRQVMELPFKGWRVADFLDLSDYDKDVRVVEEVVERLTIAFISGDQETVEKLRPLSRPGKCVIVVTMGADGSVALVNGEPIYQPSLKVANVVDSTGCGDAFGAAFTVSYWRERDVRGALQAGAQQAALVLEQFGAIGR